MAESQSTLQMPPLFTAKPREPSDVTHIVGQLETLTDALEKLGEFPEVFGAANELLMALVDLYPDDRAKLDRAMSEQDT
jgi:hypothetical protein